MIIKDGTPNHAIIVGGGMVGNIAAIALEGAGVNVTLVAPASTKPDPRTTALLHGSMEYLKKLGVWESLEAHTHPLRVMRLVDASRRLVRSPQIDFRADEIGLEAFGYNIRNQDALDVFERHIAAAPNIAVCDGVASSLQQDANGIGLTITNSDGDQIQIRGEYLVGADGRNSLVRKTFLPEVREWDYPQSALVVDFTHQVDSRQTSTEFHTETGPFTVVPQSPSRAGLVWMEKPETVDRLVSLPSGELAALLEQEMGSYLGKVSIEGMAASFPLKAMAAKTFGVDRVFLVGEAAHVFPPIGAQGFNLGLRDVEALVKTLQQTTANPGQTYSGQRQADINSRTLGVDLLNRSLLYSFLPLQVARSAAVHLLNGVAPLRKAVMKLGISTEMFIRG